VVAEEQRPGLPYFSRRGTGKKKSHREKRSVNTKGKRNRSPGTTKPRVRADVVTRVEERNKRKKKGSRGNGLEGIPGEKKR